MVVSVIWLVTNIAAYILNSSDGIPAAVKNCSHCSATHRVMIKYEMRYWVINKGSNAEYLSIH